MSKSPLIVSVAPNGAYKTKQDHASLPLTASELADTAKACLDAGAAMLHLHVRDRDGKHSLDIDTYRDAIAAIKKAVGNNLVIQATSEAAGVYSAAEQMAAMRELKPEAMSLAIREIVPDTELEKSAAEFFHWAAREKIVSQYILYSSTDLQRFQDLVNRGIIPPGHHWLLFVLGRYTTNQTSSPQQLLPFLRFNDGNVPWAACAFGVEENACLTSAMTFGGHVRVGFENNLNLVNGQLAPNNTALVEQIVDSARAIGRPLGSAAELRALFLA